jgi:hypothetical protein
LTSSAINPSPKVRCARRVWIMGSSLRVAAWRHPAAPCGKRKVVSAHAPPFVQPVGAVRRLVDKLREQFAVEIGLPGADRCHGVGDRRIDPAAA